MYGLDGNDTLDGGAGGDKLYGGKGADTFVFKAGEANGDKVYDFAGGGGATSDKLVFQGYGSGAYMTMDKGFVSIHYDGGVDKIDFGRAHVSASDYSFG